MGDLLMLNHSGELACSFLIENVFHESIFASGVDLLRGAPIFLSVADALLNALMDVVKVSFVLDSPTAVVDS